MLFNTKPHIDRDVSTAGVQICVYLKAVIFEVLVRLSFVEAPIPMLGLGKDIFSLPLI